MESDKNLQKMHDILNLEEMIDEQQNELVPQNYAYEVLRNERTNLPSQQIVNKENYSQQQERFHTVEIEQPIILIMMQRLYGEKLYQLCEQHNFQVRYRCEKTRSCIELTGKQQSTAQELHILTQFIQVSISDCRSQIRMVQIRCNQEEFEDLAKARDWQSIAHSYINEEGFVIEGGLGGIYESKIGLNKSAKFGQYLVSDRIIVKLLCVERLLGTLQWQEVLKNYFDLLIFNADPNRIALDLLGEKLSEGYQEVATYCQEGINHQAPSVENALQWFILNKNDSTFYAVVLQQRNAEYTTETFKQFLNQFEEQQNVLYGYQAKIALALPYQGKDLNVDYLKQVMRVLANTAHNQESRLFYPSKLNLLVSERQEEETKKFFEEICKSRSVADNPISDQSEGGEWSIQFMKLTKKDSEDLSISEARQQRIKSRVSPFTAQQSNNNENNNANKIFDTELQVILECIFKKSCVAICNILVPRNFFYEGLTEQYKRETLHFTVQLQEMLEWTMIFETMASRNLQTSNDLKSIICIGSEQLPSIEYETALGKYARIIQNLGIESFSYQRAWPDLTLDSIVCEVNMGQKTLTIKSENNTLIYYLCRIPSNKYIKEVHNAQKLKLISPIQDENYIQIEKQLKKKNRPSSVAVANYNTLSSSSSSAAAAAASSAFAAVPSTLTLCGADSDLKSVLQVYEKEIKSQRISHIFRVPAGNIEFAKLLAEKKLLQLQIYNAQNITVVIDGYKRSIAKHRRQLVDAFSVQLDMARPPEWQQQTRNCELFQVPPNSEEYKKIVKRVRQSISQCNILNIQRIQNIHLYENYLFEKKKLQKKGNANQLELFHGTRLNNPRLIYEGEEGFDFRLSEKGQFGKGIYFAYDASYSQRYAHNDTNNQKSFFLANVLIGNSCELPPTGSLTRPPLLPGSQTEYYDSVSSRQKSNDDDGNQMYIVYSNHKAYPAYLISMLF